MRRHLPGVRWGQQGRGWGGETGQGQGTGGFPFTFSSPCPPTPIVASDPEVLAAPTPAVEKACHPCCCGWPGFHKHTFWALQGICAFHLHCTQAPDFLLLAVLSALLQFQLEMAAPAGPNIYVYHSFRAINLKGSVQADETHSPSPLWPRWARVWVQTLKQALAV